MGDLHICSSTEPTSRADGPPHVEHDRLDDLLQVGLDDFIEVFPEGPTQRA